MTEQWELWEINRCHRRFQRPKSTLQHKIYFTQNLLYSYYKQTLYFGQPVYLRNMLEIIPIERGLRSSDSLMLVEPLPVPGVAFVERAFQFSAPRLFNRLPPSVRGAPTVSIFKSRLKTHLFSLYH